MSYTKHTWSDGELVTAAKMNNIENGIEAAASGGGGSSDFVLVKFTSNTCDHTFAELDAARQSGSILVAEIDGKGIAELVYTYEDQYYQHYDAQTLTATYNASVDGLDITINKAQIDNYGTVTVSSPSYTLGPN